MNKGGVATFNKRLHHDLQSKGYTTQHFSVFGGKGRVSLLKLLFSSTKNTVLVASLSSGLLMLLPIRFKKKVFILHGYRPFSQGLFKAFFSYFTMWVGGRRSHINLANSELTRSFYKRFMNIDAQVTPLIFESSIGDDVSITTQKPDKDIDVLFVGRLVSQKNIDVLIRAISLYKRDYKRPLNVQILGDGALRPKLMQLTAELNLTEEIRFKGFVPQDQLQDYYKRARCFVSLGLMEPYGLVFEEALAYNLKTILHRYSGILEFDQSGLLYPVNLDEQEIAAQLKVIVGDKNTGQRKVRKEERTYISFSQSLLDTIP